MVQVSSIQGYAIVSEDGMLADAAGVMPEALKVSGDKAFFERGLDTVNVVVHGRHSHEHQPHSNLRKRLILTRRVRRIEPDPSNDKALLWNPAGATLEDALSELAVSEAAVGVVGATEVFSLFLSVYSVFYLSRGPKIQLPGGRPVFSEVPGRSPEEVLAHHGLEARARHVLDPAEGVFVTEWRRSGFDIDGPGSS